MTVVKELTKILIEEEKKFKENSSYNRWQKFFEFLKDNGMSSKGEYTIPSLDKIEKIMRQTTQSNVTVKL